MSEIRQAIYDEFRGNEGDIKNRLRKYVVYFNTCHSVLDIGCGRGEFLELLRENKISAMGIDSDKGMVEICLKKSLNVLLINAFSFLKDKKGAFDGIFCSQVVEHLAPREAAELLDLCHKSLNPGGVLVFITLNPRNIRVVTNIFWLDLTHERLYPLKLLEQLLIEKGFEIIASGDDLDTTARGWVRKILRKADIYLTRGIFFSGVDIFVAARRM